MNSCGTKLTQIWREGERLGNLHRASEQANEKGRRKIDQVSVGKVCFCLERKMREAGGKWLKQQKLEFNRRGDNSRLKRSERSKFLRGKNWARKWSGTTPKSKDGNTSHLAVWIHYIFYGIEILTWNGYKRTSWSFGQTIFRMNQEALFTHYLWTRLASATLCSSLISHVRSTECTRESKDKAAAAAASIFFYILPRILAAVFLCRSLGQNNAYKWWDRFVVDGWMDGWILLVEARAG